MENLSASDVALMTRNNNGFGFDGGYGGMFGLLVLLGIMNGGFGFGGNGYDRYATQSDVQLQGMYGQLVDGNRDIMNQNNNNTNNIVGAVNQAEYETIAAMKDGQIQLQDRLSNLQVGQADMLARFNDAIGNTRLEIAGVGANIGQGIMQNRYEAALGVNKITDAIMLDGQKTRELIVQNKMEALQGRINQLELAQATSGLLRFPNAYSFPIYAPPFTQPYPTPTATTTTA